MKEIEAFAKKLKKPVLVYGLGKSGAATVKALRKAGADLVIGDDDPENLKKFKDAEVYDSQNMKNFAFMVLSPGIPFTHPEPHDIVKKAQEAGLEIICDIELFSRIYPDVKTIGITGTNGKSTTSALVHHILRQGGKNAYLGGNIGVPVLDLPMDKNPEWVVLEISSFQIDLCPSFRPDISVILNLTSDHLDRHGTMEHYAAVKERLAEPKEGSEYNTLIICTDDEHTKKIFDRAKEGAVRDIMEVSTLRAIPEGVSVHDERIHDKTQAICELSELKTLKGIHNAQNAACAYAAARKTGLLQDKICLATRAFPGLSHRQFHVRTINGVDYINDSKSTNAAAAAVALGCRNNVYWIVGGRRKKNGLEGLEEFFDRIKHAFLIGEATDDFSDWFDKYGIEYSKSFSLEKAVRDAHTMAQKNRGQPGGAGLVLLSPACASFDQFDSFEHRGDVFCELVERLEETV